MGKKTAFRNQKGYTLIEMLAAVAIVLIISMIAIPAVGGLRKNLTLTKYDDMARQVYLISQNKLTTMKASGTLKVFLEKVEKGYADSKVLFKPQDYSDAKKDWRELYYLTDEDQVYVDYIMGKDSVLTASMENGGHFLVELNPETGDVYGVFYAEETFTYDEIKALATRDKKERKGKMLGYYGGISEFSAGEEIPKEFKPKAEIVNKEDLYLKITSTGMGKLIATQSNLKVTITVTGENYNPSDPTHNIFTKDLVGGRDFVISKDKLEIIFLLDSIRGKNESFTDWQNQAENFEDITQHKITAGSNIEITVAMTYVGEDKTITGNIFAGATNSLFAAKDASGNIEVAYVRHLKNLGIETFKGGETNTIQVANPVKISQLNAIDFYYKNWSEDALVPWEEKNEAYSKNFKPIMNQNLFQGMTYEGNNNELRNFRITSNDPAGLFSTLYNSHMENMKLVDFNVTGGEYVGALAGRMNGGSIINSGAYLSTLDKNGLPLDDMDTRVKNYQIQGTSHVGGLIGYTTDGRVVTKNSFAAINVVGSGNYVGGFCGKYSAGTITDSYSSGKVTVGSASGGGFIGRIEGTIIDRCYTTSDVTYTNQWGDLRIGGFVGDASNGMISNSISYGLLQKPNGTLNKNYEGGFAGYLPDVTFSNCKFLRQPEYNYEYDENKYTGISTGTFPDLKSTETNSPDTAHPYSNALVGNRMPFAMIKTSDGGVLPHYGDWPAERKLQTSLVYYEKYKTSENGSEFGYYAETSLTAKGENGTNEEANNWVLDTLRQEPCVEDGYALMTIYTLDGFEYQLNGDLKNPKPKEKVNIVNLSDTTSAQATKITDKVSLLFTKKDSGSKYTIANAKVYRLPFDLQMTERNTAARFYDRLEISYQSKGKEAETYTFFYCPDFAKNAINPDFTSTTITDTPKNPTGENNPISVRSPRHMNALGRAAYYWNTTKWTDNKDSSRYHFVQENEIDFALYTKNYCGVNFDLMNTSAGYKYKNRPIGRPNDQPFKDSNGVSYNPSNFRNSYDGQGYKIIDFNCITTQQDDYQFTGLFGEVQQATLKNIVMIASNPQAESGRVISQYNDSKSNPKHPGVGALAGLVYADKGSEYTDSTLATVSNCSVSGYVVKYEPVNNARTPSAVGGLVGYNFGKIENSSAVNKLVTASANAGSQTRYIGGLVGSINGKGSITNSYAGGVVAAEKGVLNKTTNLASICAGFEDIYGAYYTSGQKSYRKMAIKNVYSYCEWKKENVSGGVVYGVVNTEESNKENITVENGYYLTNYVENGITLYGTNSSSAKNFSSLSRLSFSAIGTAMASGRASADNTHGYETNLQSVAYSYPAVVTNPREKETTYVHYGDWPLPREGKVGVVKLYQKNGYFADGTIVDLMDAASTIISRRKQEGKVNGYAVVFDNIFAESLSDWKVMVYYGKDSLPETTILPINITDMNLVQGQSSDFSAYVFTGKSNLKKIVIQDKDNSSEQYVFIYGNNTFTFQP